MEQFDISEDTPTLLDDLYDDGQEGGSAKDAAEGKIRPEHIGYRWVAGRGKRACAKCAALHNKVFYKNPSPGQASVDDMPDGQLHPNCSCTKEPVIGYKFLNIIVETEHPTIKPYMQGKVVRITPPGYLFRIKPFSPVPIYGKNCGSGWTDGRDASDNESLPLDDNSPEDDLDAICREHDYCYGDTKDAVEQLPCDKMIVENLSSLDPDPRNWKNPPKTEEDIEYATEYMSSARSIFEYLIKQREFEKKLRENPDGVIPMMP